MKQLRILFQASLLALFVCSAAAKVSNSNLMRRLPAGAKLDLPPSWARLAKGGEEQVVLFYSSPTMGSRALSSHVMVLQQKGPVLKVLWKLDCNGAYSGFFPGTGVYDINHTGRPKIVVNCAGFTVCPNRFGIFEYSHGAFRSVPSDFAPLKTCRVELSDLNNDGIPEIVNFPHPSGALPQIFRWNGVRYAEANADFPKFWSTFANKNFRIEDIRNPSRPLPLDVLASSCRNSLAVFQWAGNPMGGRRFCAAVAKRIRSGMGIAPPSSAKDRERVVAEIQGLVRQSAPASAAPR
jgi:hypothetical protein